MLTLAKIFVSFSRKTDEIFLKPSLTVQYIGEKKVFNIKVKNFLLRGHGQIT